MEMSTVTMKGQIVIPAKLRQKTGIKEGTRVYLEEKNGDIIVHPATPAFYQRHFGLLKGQNLVGDLAEFRKKEKENEGKKIAKK